ncbi:hypothetical protein [Bacillus phage PBS1]|nr:hypothetical protein INTERNEXUS_111 [Bacillus phage vB_BspM_Internexus]BDE75238.1 hypothetical protein [Bacillus phage PBS1]
MDLFDGKISISEMINMDLSMLISLEKEKAKQVEKEAKKIMKAQQDSKEKPKTITNKK